MSSLRVSQRDSVLSASPQELLTRPPSTMQPPEDVDDFEEEAELTQVFMQHVSPKVLTQILLGMKNILLDQVGSIYAPNHPRMNL